MFEFLANLFNLLLYRPLFNALILIYNYLPVRDFGVAIVLLTVFIRLVLYPLTAKALHSQRVLQKLQPKLQEIQKKYKDDRETQTKETLELYRKEKLNPFSGLFLALIQLPILIALYQVFWEGLKAEALVNLYGFVANPGQINAMFLQLADLSKPNGWMAFIAGILQFFQTKMMLPNRSGSQKAGDIGAMVQRQMVYFFPFLTVVILLRLPSALGFYWIVSSIFSIGQQYLVLKEKQPAQPTT